MTKKYYYAVYTGRKPGIYQEWSGPNGAEIQVKGYPGAQYKGFALLKDAKAWMQKMALHNAHNKEKRTILPRLQPISTDHPVFDEREKPIAPHQASGIQLSHGKASDHISKVIIHTDGACIGNPGPGGFGVVIIERENRVEYSGGYRLTTNNRMELTACIVGLQALDSPGNVIIYSDSRYVVNGMSAGWASRWQENGWRGNREYQVKNSDLWSRLLELSEKHKVEFRWVGGHAGNPENERCNQLAQQASYKTDLPVDNGYELIYKLM